MDAREDRVIGILSEALALTLIVLGLIFAIFLLVSVFSGFKPEPLIVGIIVTLILGLLRETMMIRTNKG